MPIYQEKNKVNGLTRYYIRTYVKYSNGETKQITKHNDLWVGKEGKLLAQREEIVLKSNIYNDKNNLFFDDLADIYLQRKIKEVKLSSFMRIKQVTEQHIKVYFKNRRVKNLINLDILKWHESLDNKNLSISTKKFCHITLSAILDYGVKFYNLSYNVAKNVGNFKSPKSEKKEMNFLTLDEFNKFIPFEENDLYKKFFTVLFYTGLRKGELLALTKEDVTGDEININKTYNSKLKITTTPKTKKSIRKLKTSHQIINILNSLNDDMFSNIKTTTLDRKCKKNCLKAEIFKNIRIQDFRHSFASLCIYNDVPITILSAYLGHDSIKTTLDIYSHLYPNSQDKLVEKIFTQDQEIIWSCFWSCLCPLQ